MDANRHVEALGHGVEGLKRRMIRTKPSILRRYLSKDLRFPAPSLCFKCRHARDGRQPLIREEVGRRNEAVRMLLAPRCDDRSVSGNYPGDDIESLHLSDGPRQHRGICCWRLNHYLALCLGGEVKWLGRVDPVHVDAFGADAAGHALAAELAERPGMHVHVDNGRRNGLGTCLGGK